jgi:glycine betaine/proline transport system substrate-binding protein
VRPPRRGGDLLANPDDEHLNDTKREEVSTLMKQVRVRAVAAGAAIALAASLVAACGSSNDAGGSGSGSATSGSAGSGASSSASSGSASASAGSASAGSGSATSGSASSSSATSGSASSGSASAGSGSASSGSSTPVDLSKDTKKDITIPIAAGWDEDVAVTNLWKYVLEQKGYTVKTPTLDIAPVFKGVASGDYDIFFDTWLPNTHKNYWKQFGDQVEDIHVWYDSAPLTIAVPTYMKIDSMDQLKSIGDEVDKTIIGIDPGAGLTDVTQNSMMPAYGLDDWTLKTSSTSAMLAALKKATDAKKPIVVTLWRPHWAYGAFPIKDLKDPKGAMGKPDEIHVIGSKAFAKADPGVVAALKNFKMDPDTLTDLETVVLRQYGDGKYQEGVKAWAKDHQDFVNGLLGG